MRVPTAVSALMLLWSSAGHAAPPMVPISACGDVVPRRAIGYLTNDLDCEFAPGGPIAAVLVSRGGTLELRGHSIRADFLFAAVICGELVQRPDLPPALEISGRCRVDGGGGTITRTGLLGDKLTVTDVTIDDTYGGAIYCDNSCKVVNATITDSGTTAVESRGAVSLVDSTITGSAETGVFARRLRALRSSIGASGTSSECTGGFPPCADLVLERRPNLHATTCGTSAKPVNQSPIPTWGVCADD
jgi:hypothetical protein